MKGFAVVRTYRLRPVTRPAQVSPTSIEPGLRRALSALLPVLVAATLFVAPTRSSAFSGFSLGNAGGFAVLTLDGKFDDSLGSIIGNVGVASSGQSYHTSGNTTVGDIFLNTGSSFAASGASATQHGTIHQNAATDAFLAQAILDAQNASTAAAGLSGAISLGAFNNSTGNQDFTALGGGQHVFSVSSVSFSGGHTVSITGAPGATLIFNVASGADFKLTGGSLLVNGITADNVLWNVLGTGANIATSGGGNSSVIDGIVLAVNRGAQITPGAINGALIVGLDAGIASGTEVTFVPEPTSFMLVFASFGLLGVLRKRF